MKSGYTFEAKRSPNGKPHKYHQQYHNAKRCAKERGIEWQFTYDTWEAWWGDDIVNRGPYKGQLVMARHNDTGPYHPVNVRKELSSNNCSEGSKGKSKFTQLGLRRSVESKLRMSIAQLKRREKEREMQ